MNALNVSNPPVSVENSVNNSNIMNNMSRGGGNMSINRGNKVPVRTEEEN